MCFSRPSPMDTELNVHVRTQIQILLHLMKLSLPPASQLPSSPKKSSPSKRKVGAAPPERAAPSTEDRLESLMDRLSRWQLMSNIDSTTPKGPSSVGTDDRDWTQRFCEDVVEPSYAPPPSHLHSSSQTTRFASQQREMCTLLRSKVFPHVVFSDDEFDLERTATPSDAPSRKRSKAPSRLGSIVAEGRALSRARSLSAALDEEERSLRRSASLSASANAGKRALVREVSMSRSLRAPTPKGEPAMKANAPAVLLEKSRAAKGGGGGVTLVEGTPVKREKSRTDLPTRRSSGQGDAFGASMSGLLVESTPTKTKGR
jgi:hypothetical protein